MVLDRMSYSGYCQSVKPVIARSAFCDEAISRTAWGLRLPQRMDRSARNDKCDIQTCHCEERFLRRSNLLDRLGTARNDKCDIVKIVIF